MCVPNREYEYETSRSHRDRIITEGASACSLNKFVFIVMYEYE